MCIGKLRFSRVWVSMKCAKRRSISSRVGRRVRDWDFLQV
jgi:hypothetical protein